MFAPNLQTGTRNLTVPIEVPAGATECNPDWTSSVRDRWLNSCGTRRDLDCGVTLPENPIGSTHRNRRRPVQDDTGTSPLSRSRSTRSAR